MSKTKFYTLIRGQEPSAHAVFAKFAKNFRAGNFYPPQCGIGLMKGETPCINQQRLNVNYLPPIDESNIAKNSIFPVFCTDLYRKEGIKYKMKSTYGREFAIHMSLVSKTFK